MATERPLSAGTPGRGPDRTPSDNTLDGDTNPPLNAGPRQRAPTNNTLIRQSLGLTVNIPRVQQFAPVVDLGDAPTYYADHQEATEHPITSFHMTDLTGCPGSRATAELRRYHYISLLESSGQFGRADYLEWHRQGVCPCFFLQDEDDDVDTDTDQSWADYLSCPAVSREHGVGPGGRPSEPSVSFELVDLFSPEDEVPSETTSVQPSGSGISRTGTRLQVLCEEPGPQSPWAMARRVNPNLCANCLEMYVGRSRLLSPLGAFFCGENSDAEGGRAVGGPRGHAHSHTGDDGLSRHRCAACNVNVGASSRLTRHSDSAQEVAVSAVVTGWVNMVRRYLDI